MSTLIFDIETIGDDWSRYDLATKNVLTRWLDKTAKSEAEYLAGLEDLKNGLGFSPLTGKIVAIGLYDLERSQGAVYYTGDGKEEDEVVGDYILKQRTEREMLADFWDGAVNYDTFVTFNGYSFDVPFLLHRSVTNDVKPSCNLMSHRYLQRQSEQKHVDLLDQLTFYGAMRKRPSLHLFCRAYGIDSPKTEVSGDDVKSLFTEREYKKIALYNKADVQATTELYKKWCKYLNFSS